MLVALGRVGHQELQRGLRHRSSERASGARGQEKAIRAIEEKLARPVHSASERKALLAQEAVAAKHSGRRPRRLSFGYRSAGEHAMKRRRLEHLYAEAQVLQADVDAGRVHITRGGKKLLRSRLHLDEAGLCEEKWRARWHAKRWGFGANGEAGKTFGNETIRLSPDGTLEVDLPPALAHLANVTARGTTRYRFSAPVSFSYRRDDWTSQVEADRAVAYDVVFDPSGKVYLDASFTPVKALAVPELDEVLRDPGLRVLAVDLNHGFLAPVVLDRAGNPVIRLPHIPLVTEDLPASVRDGHLRQALTSALDFAEAHGCRLVVVENLGFSDMRAKGRERYGSAKWFRKLVCGMPTAQVRDRLVAMAARREIAVAGVPAAYSSIWGAEHWAVPLSSKQHQVSGHTAAAVVLGRRALGHSARRRPQASPGVTAPDQRIEAAAVSEDTGVTAGAESYHVGQTGSPGARHHATRKPSRREGNPTHRPPAGAEGSETRKRRRGTTGARPAKTVRAGPEDAMSYSLLR